MFAPITPKRKGSSSQSTYCAGRLPELHPYQVDRRQNSNLFVSNHRLDRFMPAAFLLALH